MFAMLSLILAKTPQGTEKQPTCRYLLVVDAIILQKRVQRDMDYFFTSINLANKLNTEKTTLLDAIRKQRKEVRKVETIRKDKPLHSSEVFVSPSNVTLTIYKAKKAKLAHLLSSMHKTVTVDLAHQKVT